MILKALVAKTLGLSQRAENLGEFRYSRFHA